MDDGLGFSIGALFGGFLYQKIGGMKSFRIFALIALITCIAHAFLRPAATHEIRVAKNANSIVKNGAIDETENIEAVVEDKKLTAN